MAREDGLADARFKARHILACFDLDRVTRAPRLRGACFAI